MKQLLAVLLLAFTLPAWAQPYVFVGTGFARGAGGEHQWGTFTTPGVGYQVSPRIAIEAAYFDTEIEASSTAALNPTQGVVTYRRLDLSAASLAIVGRLPISERLSLTGDATLYRLRGKVKERDTRFNFAPPFNTATDMVERSASGSATSYGLGAGIAFNVSKAVELRARMQWVRGADDVFGPGRDLERTRIASMSLAYRF